tara:strand:- start:31 stop:2526 length:2496 start_codon:yes stop_codon:yes gene_type:complete
MGIILDSINFSNEFEPTDTTWLLANIGEKITVTIDFTVRADAIPNGSTKTIECNPPGFTGNNIIQTIGFAGFQDFNLGDDIVIYDTFSGGTNGGTYTIIEKISASIIRVDAALASETIDSANDYVALVTPMEAIRYNWNLIGNSENPTFNSKIDGTNQELTVNNYPQGSTPVTAMGFFGDLSYQIGSATITRLQTGVLSGQQQFRIIHEFYITPFFLSAQYTDLQNGVAPSYFLNAECLKFIYRIEAGLDLSNPNSFQFTETLDVTGNSGWFDESFSSGYTDYSVKSISYEDDISTNSVPGIQLSTDKTRIKIVIENTISSPFLNNNTDFTANFSYLPEFQTEYQQNNKTVIENFYFDRGFQTVGSAAIAGENFGTDEQVFETIEATFTSTSEIEVELLVSLSPAMIADIEARGRKAFAIWITTQNHLLATADADKVALLADVEVFYQDTTDAGLLTWANPVFLKHYETDPITEGADTINGRIEDDILRYDQFYIDRGGREDNTINIQQTRQFLIAKNSVTGDEFILEQFFQNWGGTTLVNDGTPSGQYTTQFINFVQDRVFKMPTNNERKQIKVDRRADLDTTDFRYYEMYYPFMMRWEDWIALLNANTNFFDASLPQNGLNQLWNRYSTFANWDIYYRNQVILNQLDSITNINSQLTYSQDKIIDSFTYLESTDWINEDISSFTLTGSPLLSGGTEFIQGFEDTKIIASKEWAGAGVKPVNATDVVWVMRIEVYEQGSITDIRFISSVYDWLQFSWFKSTDLSNKLVLSETGGVFKAEALIDYTLIPAGTQFRVSARIYDKRTAVVSGKLLEDGTQKYTEASVSKQLNP